MEKSPLKFSLARNMSSLDTREMGTAAKESDVRRFKAVLKTMNEANCVADNKVDELLQQNRQYIQHILVKQLCRKLQNTATSLVQQREWMYCCLRPWPISLL